MNNNYDREESYKTHDELSGGSLSVTITDPEPAVKLIMFLNGEEVISTITENSYGSTITLSNPLKVMVQSTSSDGEDRSSTVAFTDWMPLSQDREIAVSKSFIATITTPLDSLVKSYQNG